MNSLPLLCASQPKEMMSSWLLATLGHGPALAQLHAVHFAISSHLSSNFPVSLSVCGLRDMENQELWKHCKAIVCKEAVRAFET